MIAGLATAAFHLPVPVDGAAAAAEVVGSPMYDMAAEHGLAVAAVALLPVAAWLARAFGGPRVARVVAGYDSLPPLHAFAFWLLAVTAAVHLGLAVGHGGPGLRLLFLLDAILLAAAARRLAVGRSWRLPAGVLLMGSLASYWLALLGGEAPDQVGLATKFVEITALAIVLRPADARHRIRGWAASTATVGLVVVAASAAWIGAFAAAGGVTGHTHDHGAGAVPGPGTLLHVAKAHGATADEVRAASDLYRETVAALARYADPTVAAADGYEVAGIAGLDFHASNKAYEADGVVLDAARPETLVYAMGPGGPVLLGAMFQMPAVDEPGPTVGGPLTVWHGHEQICFSLVPPGLTGIVSPLGGCPVGSLAIPRTVEMMHVWTAPGAPQPFGDLDDAWRRAYVNGSTGRR
jgi:hypothetical protein